MENHVPSELKYDRTFYSAHFMDLALWEPIVQQVCSKHDLGCERITPGIAGTFPTFLVELDSFPKITPPQSVVVKFFGPLFDGDRSFLIEREMGEWLSRQSLPIPSPAIQVQDRFDPDWSYLIFEGVQGESVRQAWQLLSTRNFDEIAGEVGAYLKVLSTASLTGIPGSLHSANGEGWAEFIDFLDQQRTSCRANHLLWGDLPSQVVQQIEPYLLPLDELLDFSSPPHLIHADLTGDHLFGCLGAGGLSKPTHTLSLQPTGNEWKTLAIIDWGDARIGNILYELVAVHIDLFQVEKRLLSICIDHYGLPDFYMHNFARKAFCMALLHQFPLPAWIASSFSEVQSMQEFAECLYGV
jgi:Phosphotransferase enzyme family